MFKRIIVCVVVVIMMVCLVSCENSAKGVEPKEPTQEESNSDNPKGPDLEPGKKEKNEQGYSDKTNVSKEKNTILNFKSVETEEQCKYQIKEKDAIEKIVIQSNQDIKEIKLYALEINLIDKNLIDSINDIPKDQNILIVSTFGEALPTRLISVELKNGEIYNVIPCYNGRDGGYIYSLDNLFKVKPNKNADIYVNYEFIEYSLEYYKDGNTSSIAFYDLSDDSNSNQVIKLISNKDIKYIELVELDEQGVEMNKIASIDNLKSNYDINIRADYTLNNKLIRFITSEDEEYSFVPYYNKDINRVEFVD